MPAFLDGRGDRDAAPDDLEILRSVDGGLSAPAATFSVAGCRLRGRGIAVVMIDLGPAADEAVRLLDAVSEVVATDRRAAMSGCRLW